MAAARSVVTAAAARSLTAATTTRSTAVVVTARAANAAARRGYGSTALARGAATTPPLPPFARSPAPQEKLVENIDAVWNDGVAPELALDFDCQHVDSTEGLLWWLGGFGFFATVYNVIKSSNPEGKKPCVNRRMNMVIENPVVGPPPTAAGAGAGAAD
mmetsp:Transcript_5755/g.12483  ORF Transcript_5755/g.12483 Transcript_5755/m.12483 type:complete len:159 (-) Transcript_5755:172-648(-)